MRLYIQFRLDSPLMLPINYQQMLQGFIYNQIEDETFSRFLHEEGYVYGKRHFKLFSFSRLMGQAIVNRKQKTIIFKKQVSWQVSSCLPKFIHEFGQSLLMKDSLHFMGQPVIIEELHYKPLTIEKSTCTIRMLSPITIHSTYVSIDGKKTTQFFAPHDPAFAHLINENLAKKYKAYYGKEMEGRLEIKPVQVKKRDKVITRFKGFIIEAWNGVYALQGDPKILTFACTAGIGGRNSNGFGLPEIFTIPGR